MKLIQNLANVPGDLTGKHLRLFDFHFKVLNPPGVNLEANYKPLRQAPHGDNEAALQKRLKYSSIYT